MSAKNSDFLNSLLDKIDNHNQNNKMDKSSKFETDLTHGLTNQKLAYLDEGLNWRKYYDNSSCKSYYHNHTTNVTTWDKPDCFQDLTTNDFSYDSNISQNNLQEDYKAVAYFNKGIGHMSSASTYWEKMGRANDKAGRQLGVFMDLNELEENRIQAKKMKENARKYPNANIDWAKLKKEKQLKKRKASLLND